MLPKAGAENTKSCGEASERVCLCAGLMWNIRFLSGNFHPVTGCWKLLPEPSYRWIAKTSNVVPGEHFLSGVISRSHSPIKVFMWDTRSTEERLTGRKCRSFIACLFWLQTAGKGGKGGATTEMGPWTFCSLLSTRLRCSVLEESKENMSFSEH